MQHSRLIMHGILFYYLLKKFKLKSCYLPSYADWLWKSWKEVSEKKTKKTFKCQLLSVAVALGATAAYCGVIPSHWHVHGKVFGLGLFAQRSSSRAHICCITSDMLNCDESYNEACERFVFQLSNVFSILLTWHNSPKPSDSSRAGTNFDRLT